MLLITAELLPGGDLRRRSVIGEMRITNESDLASVSSYAVDIYQTGEVRSGADAWQLALVIDGHCRSDGVWSLVADALAQALPAINGKSPGKLLSEIRDEKPDPTPKVAEDG